MKNQTLLFVALLALAGVAQAAPAGGGRTMAKCVDDQGRVYYGDAIPPDVLAKCRSKSEVTSKGTERKKTEFLTPEERRAQEQERQAGEAREQDEARRKLDQERRDRALLASYANEKEIDLARDRNLAQTIAQLQSIDARLKSAQGRLAEFNKQAAGFAGQKKPVPADLTNDIKAAEQSVQALEQEKAKKNQEADATRARFEADKQRYRELKVTAPR